jgi:signal transduction histidine kinase
MILLWVRGAAVAACLVAGLTNTLEDTRPALPAWAPPPWLEMVMHVGQAAVFFHVSRFFPPRSSFPRGWIVLQFLFSLGIDSVSSIINMLTVALVVPKARQTPWIVAVAVGMIANFSLLLGLQLSGQDASKLPFPAIALAVGLGVVELGAWLALIYLVGTLIVGMEEDRRRLTALNAELISSRAMLADGARIAERLEIARELHDSLGHHLTTLNLELEIAQHSAAERDEQVRKAQFLARLLLADLRDTVTSWRRELSGGLPEALRSLADGVSGVEVVLRLEENLPPLDPARAHVLLRSAQEGVTNALRHSGAAQIRVELEREGENLMLSVSDQGAGCGAIIPGNGLAGILARVREHGGDASFTSPATGGFVLRVSLPLAEVPA